MSSFLEINRRILRSIDEVMVIAVGTRRARQAWGVVPSPFGRRTAEAFPKVAIQVRDRVVADLGCNLLDTQIRRRKNPLRRLEPCPPQMMNETVTGVPRKQPVEVRRSQVDLSRD